MSGNDDKVMLLFLAEKSSRFTHDLENNMTDLSENNSKAERKTYQRKIVQEEKSSDQCME